jgi:ferredoxin
MARKKGIKGSRIEEIEMVGDRLKEEELPRFRLPDLSDVEFGPKFVRSHARNLFTSKPMENKKRCTRCGQCAEICPPGVIEVVQKGLMFDYDRCIRCYCCQEICPEGAMEIKQGIFLRLVRK